MKKVNVFALLLACVLMLTACGGGISGNNVSSKDEADPLIKEVGELYSVGLKSINNTPVDLHTYTNSLKGLQKIAEDELYSSEERGVAQWYGMFLYTVAQLHWIKQRDNDYIMSMKKEIDTIIDYSKVVVIDPANVHYYINDLQRIGAAVLQKCDELGGFNIEDLQTK